MNEHIIDNDYEVLVIPGESFDPYEFNCQEKAPNSKQFTFYYLKRKTEDGSYKK